MSKVLRPLAIIAAIAINVIPGAGQAISGALVGALGGTFGAVAAAGAITGVLTAGLTVAGLSSAASLLQRKPRFDATGITGRLQLSDQVDQWIAVGETALPSQMIFWGTSGGENKELSIVVAHACHAIHSFTGLTINGIATTYPTPGGDYAGILTIQTAIGTHTTNPFTGIQGGWTGPGRDLAMSHFRWTYNQEKLTSGLPQNIQFTGKGIRVYDPRRDSTRGGSGSMRADDETTWAYEVGGTQLGNNPALVHLTYLLGWKKNGLLWAGKGESPTDINFADYIAAANICDELVSGERRYTIGGLISLAEAHNVNEGRILSCCAGKKTDAGGLLGIWVAHDDTAVPLMSFTAGDIVGDIKWEPLPEGQTRNTARGSFLDPANGWSAQPYQEVRPADLLALDNGVELVDRLDFPMVTNANQARRLAGIRLRESRQGIFTAPLRLKALGVQTGRVVAQTLAQQGWTNKRFRVETMTLERETVTLRARAVAAGDYVDAGPSTLTPVSAPPTQGYVPFFEDGANLTAPNAANRVPFSLFEGVQGWAAFTLTSTSITPIFRFVDAGKVYIVANATFGAAGQQASIAGTRRFAVEGGERLSIQTRLNVFETSGPEPDFWQFIIEYYEGDTLLPSPPVLASEPGNIGGDNLVQVFNVAPAAATSARLVLLARADGAGVVQINLLRPMVAGALANQTVHPPFTPGPNAADGADVTRDTLPTVGVGAWTSGNSYGVGAVVTDANAIWTARIANTASAANRPGLDGTWSLFSGSPDISNQATSASAVFFRPAFTSTTYGSPVANITVKPGAAGNVDLSISASVTLETGASASAAAKIQRETTPGTWVDVGSEQVSATVTDATPESREVALGFTRQATGLINGTAYNFRALVRRSGGAGGAEIEMSGVLTGAGR